jgi:hypothetical protein
VLRNALSKFQAKTNAVKEKVQRLNNLLGQLRTIEEDKAIIEALDCPELLGEYIRDQIRRDFRAYRFMSRHVEVNVCVTGHYADHSIRSQGLICAMSAWDRERVIVPDPSLRR